MNYRIIDERQYPFLERVLRFRHCEERKEELLSLEFLVDKEQERLQLFREKLLQRRDKKFLIIGDYDCDGIMATTLSKALFIKLGISHHFYIPSRFKDGYGLTENLVEIAHQHHFEVIYCVDNGVSALAAIRKAKEYHIEVMIMDHHEYETEPEVAATIAF